MLRRFSSWTKKDKKSPGWAEKASSQSWKCELFFWTRGKLPFLEMRDWDKPQCKHVINSQNEKIELANEMN